MLIETERTPNPATLKFLPGQPVLAGGADFSNPEEAERSPLAKALFGQGDVERVYFGDDFITVTKSPGSADWAELKLDILGLIVDHFASGAPIILDDSDEDLNTFDDPEDAEIVAQIKELLETRIRPAVANDGGDIVYRGFQKGIVYLNMRGSCAGCPSSTATLKGGIENLLRHYVPEVVEVRAI